MVNKELEVKACKVFVCPNLSLIDQKGKELKLKEKTIKRAKDLAIEYFKKTYHKPPYSSALFLLPSFLYIASVLEHERRFQIEVATVFGSTNATIHRWNKNIIKTLKLHMPYDKNLTGERIDIEYVSKGQGRGSKRQILEMQKEFVCPDLSPIEKIGKSLGLRKSTIDKAKELAIRYFKATYKDPHYSKIEYVYPALIYDASIIQKDRRTQMEISMVSNISEGYISRFHMDIIETLGIKIIYRHDNSVISVSDIN